MQRQFLLFLLRWLLNSVGLWVAARILSGHGITYDPSEGVALFLIAGLVLSIVNVFLKPLLVILSLPAILLTLGLFTLVVNGVVVYVAGFFVSGLDITFFAAILAGMIVSLINYVVTNLVDTTRKQDGFKQ